MPLGPIKAGLGSSSETDSSGADGRQRERALMHWGRKQSLCNQSSLGGVRASKAQLLLFLFLFSVDSDGLKGGTDTSENIAVLIMILTLLLTISWSDVLCWSSIKRGYKGGF